MSHQSPGVFILSLDTELAWGAVDRSMTARRRREYALTREVTAQFLELLSRYDVRATWAVVGHLLLEECQPVDGRKHPEVVRPRYRWLPGDWFDNDPCGNVDTQPAWYAPDMVRQVMACPVPQEIAAHGFSHMIAGDEGCGPDAFESELSAMDAVASEWGMRLESFVFPRNAVGHVDALERHGYRAYRGTAPAWYARLPGPLRRASRFADAFLPMTAPAVRPAREGGLWNIPASCQYLHRSGWAKRVPMAFRTTKAVSGLRQAARTGRVFHLWLHPFNLASDPANLLAGLERIFQELKALRDSGLLVNRTMGEMAASLDAGLPTNSVRTAREQQA